MDLVPQYSAASWSFNQSIPRMRSMVEDFKMMGETRNTIPSISTMVSGTILVVWHWPIGVRTTIGGFIFSNAKLCDNANASDMNECDAPVSNKTVAGTELTRRVPITVAGCC